MTERAPEHPHVLRGRVRGHGDQDDVVEQHRPAGAEARAVAAILCAAHVREPRLRSMYSLPTPAATTSTPTSSSAEIPPVRTPTIASTINATPIAAISNDSSRVPERCTPRPVISA